MLAASALETARILLNSKSSLFPNGLANSSGQVGRHLVDNVTAILFQASANSRMRKALENMQNQMIILRHRTFELSSQNSVRQHRGILNALQREDREAAERLMVEHIRYVRERLLTYLTTQTPVVETGIRTAGEVAGQVTSPPSSSSFRRSES